MKRDVGLHPQPNKNTYLAQLLNWGVKVSPLTLLPDSLLPQRLLPFCLSLSAVVSNEKVNERVIQSQCS